MAKKILIIEDDIPLYNMYAAELKLKGYDVSNVSDGNNAFETVKQSKPDMILLDIVLPGRNGLDILADLKAAEETKAIKIIMLTNYGGDANVSRSMELGADDYLLKYNVVPADVLSKVGNMLGDIATGGVSLKS